MGTRNVLPTARTQTSRSSLIFRTCVTCRTMAENLAELPGLKEGQEIIKPMSDPIKSSGHLQVGKGSKCAKQTSTVCGCCYLLFVVVLFLVSFTCSDRSIDRHACLFLPLPDTFRGIVCGGGPSEVWLVCEKYLGTTVAHACLFPFFLMFLSYQRCGAPCPISLSHLELRILVSVVDLSRMSPMPACLRCFLCVLLCSHGRTHRHTSSPRL